MARTAEELDRMHDAVVARYPAGLTPRQFIRVSLETADDEDRVYPHSLADWFARHSLIVRMQMEGLISNRSGPNKAPEYRITEKGRQWLMQDEKE